MAGRYPSPDANTRPPYPQPGQALHPPAAAPPHSFRQQPQQYQQPPARPQPQQYASPQIQNGAPPADLSQQRPVPVPVRPALPSRPVPPGVAGATAAMGAASLGAHRPQYPMMPRQFGPPQPEQRQQLQPPQAAAVSDPHFLPRPDFSAPAVNKRVAQGDAMLPPPPADLLATQETTGRLGASEPAACPPEVFVPASGRNVRLTVGAFPSSVSLAKKYALPLGAVIQPLADPAPDEPQIPVVNFGATGIVRCRRCRSYINFSCRFTDGGRRWMCSLCQYPNDCPSDYFSPLDQGGRRRDAAQRPELHRGSIEFVAPAEYMVRPPMPPVYLFVLEVTPASMASGALAAMVSGIKASVGVVPNEGRTRVGIITFDAAVHFYSLPAGDDADPSVAVVADIDDMFIPTPENILAQLSECQPAFEKALDLIHTSCKAAQVPGPAAKPSSSASCLGAALQGAQRVMEHYGGKMIVLATSRPTSGPGALRDRSENNALGTDRERAVMRPESTFYRQMAVSFSKFQISCDLFLCPPPPAAFMDVATIAQIAKFTGGEIFRTPGFEAHRDHPLLQRVVYRTLSRVTGFEAVMRVRATKSVRVTQFHGRFFVRSTDLLAMPNVDSDKAYAVQFAFDEATIHDGPFTVQVALLYTTTSGERRIRVHTVAVPVSNSISDLICRADSPATAHILLRMASEAIKDRALDELKKTLTDKVVSALAAYRAVCQQQYQGIGGGVGGGASAAQFYLPDAMHLLPLFMHGMLRSGILSRDTASAFLFRFDDKAALVHTVDAMNVAQTTAMLYPNMIPVLPVPVTAGGEGKCLIPAGAPASAATLTADSGVLVDDGQTLVLWLGASVAPSFAAELLGVSPQALGANVDPRQLAYRLMEPVERKGVVAHVRSIVHAVLALRPAGTGLHVVVSGGAMQARIEALCVEDRTSSSIGYKEVLSELCRQVASKAGPNA
jgi:protein transport protein SEC24